jgi:hypothetical protein
MTTCPTIRYDIFIAGDIDQAKNTCRSFCFAVGLCVTVEPVAYIYTGAEEQGVRVGLINYPRFPSDAETIRQRAYDLARLLMHDLYQHSYSIVGPDETTWFSRRPA